MDIVHLDQAALAARWRLSERTLERWRWMGVGPCYLKIGGHVVYRLRDIEAYEQAHMKTTVGIVPDYQKEIVVPCEIEQVAP
ncbi:MAG: helix-turn-helix domain-containing protein [Alphaproteobacteria bacterium]|nr:helix-turn-helix domain-containing protein [Alphaproteobacteria bacterium]